MPRNPQDAQTTQRPQAPRTKRSAVPKNTPPPIPAIRLQVEDQHGVDQGQPPASHTEQHLSHLPGGRYTSQRAHIQRSPGPEPQRSPRRPEGGVSNRAEVQHSPTRFSDQRPFNSVEPQHSNRFEERQGSYPLGNQQDFYHGSHQPGPHPFDNGYAPTYWDGVDARTGNYDYANRHPFYDPSQGRHSAPLNPSPYGPSPATDPLSSLHPTPGIRRSRSCFIGAELPSQRSSYSPDSRNLFEGQHSGMEFPAYSPVPEHIIVNTLRHYTNQDLFLLFLAASNEYGTDTRTALLARALLEERHYNLKVASQSSESSQSKPGSFATFLSTLANLSYIHSKPSKKTASPSGSPRTFGPVGSEHHYPSSPSHRSYSPLPSTLDNAGARDDLTTYVVDIPPIWEPHASTATIFMNPRHDTDSRILLSPRGARIFAGPLGFCPKPPGHVWGVSPSLEFLTFRTANGPVVLDLKNNRVVSPGLALRLKAIRDLADQEYAQGRY